MAKRIVWPERARADVGRFAKRPYTLRVIRSFLHICVKMPQLEGGFSHCESPRLLQLIDSKALKIISRVFCTASHFLIPTWYAGRFRQFPSLDKEGSGWLAVGAVREALLHVPPRWRIQPDALKMRTNH